MFQIMVVEDDINARRLMQAVIEQNSYAAIPASDGAEALALMDKKHVDLIVLDVMIWTAIRLRGSLGARAITCPY